MVQSRVWGGSTNAPRLRSLRAGDTEEDASRERRRTRRAIGEVPKSANVYAETVTLVTPEENKKAAKLTTADPQTGKHLCLDNSC